MNNSKIKYSFNSPVETQAFAASLAEKIPPGTVMALIGDLGTGKTTFSQGFARGLGIDVSVGSPTFKIVSEYEGESTKLYHVDCYRLEGGRDFLNIGGESLLNPADGITLIEWADIIEEVLPRSVVEIRFDRKQGEADYRELTIKNL